MKLEGVEELVTRPLRGGLLKWIGNKYRFAPAIIRHFPERYSVYREPFVGSGAVLATLAPQRAAASDSFAPLVEIWQALSSEPQTIKSWYQQRWEIFQSGERARQYEEIKASYNAHPNGADLLFLCRSCYGGVVRFRQADGYMSTPCGIHKPISPDSFAKRVDIWAERLRGTTFQHADFRDAMARAGPGDLIYCDPPYVASQSILYGSQGFELSALFGEIAACKQRGAYVALGIDGSKGSGSNRIELEIPKGLFAREALVNCGRSMLKRFQMGGRTLEREVVSDRLLLTY